MAGDLHRRLAEIGADIDDPSLTEPQQVADHLFDDRFVLRQIVKAIAFDYRNLESVPLERVITGLDVEAAMVTQERPRKDRQLDLIGQGFHSGNLPAVWSSQRDSQSEPGCERR